MILAEGKFLFQSGNFKSAFWFSWSLGRLEIDCSRVMPIHKLFSKIHRFKQVYLTKYRNTQTNLLIIKCWKFYISFISSLCYIPLSFMLVTPHLNPTQGEVITWNFFFVWRGNLKIIDTSNSSEELLLVAFWEINVPLFIFIAVLFIQIKRLFWEFDCC